MRYLLCMLALGLVGCGGGDDDNGNGTTHQFACDVGASTAQHYCYEFSWNGPANAADAYQGVCSSGGAATVTACPSASKVGGCRYTASSGGVTVTWTAWFYFGTPAEDMAGCVSSGGLTATWINP